MNTRPASSTRLRDVPRPLLLGTVLWTAFALILAATGALGRELWLVPLLVVSPIVGTVLVWRRWSPFRQWTDGLDLRWPILFHLVRIAFGALFLVEYAAGRLPATFAERGGYGDILAGLLAIVAAIVAGKPNSASAQPASRSGRAVVFAFSVVGLIDILLVLATAQVGIVIDKDPQLLAVLPHLPYSLLPSVVVPLVILTHILTLQRLRQR